MTSKKDLEPAKRKTFLGIDWDDWLYFGAFFLNWALPALLATACWVWWYA